MIQELVDRVTAFHEKHGFPTSVDERRLQGDVDLLQLSNDLSNLSQLYLNSGIDMQEGGDPRLYRAHLLIEELGELVRGMSRHDETEILDGGMDLLYVLIGTIGMTYNLPLDEAWIEVCNSNDSKATRNKEDDPRLRDKGPDYFAPDLDKVLTQHRCIHEWSPVGSTDDVKVEIECETCGKKGVSHE